MGKTQRRFQIGGDNAGMEGELAKDKQIREEQQNMVDDVTSDVAVIDIKRPVKYTPENLPATRMEPLEDRLIIFPDPAPETMRGIIVPEAVQEDHAPKRGTVIAVGPGKNMEGSGILIKIYLLLCWFFKKQPELTSVMPFKPGDRVMYGHFAGIKIQDPDDEYLEVLIMRKDDVFVKL